MPLMPLDIPPGIVRKGTDTLSAGRWRDGSLVRWRNGVMQPVLGWVEKTATAVPAAPRGALAWRENGGDPWLALGIYNALYVMSATGVVSNITPATLTGGRLDASANTGYGGGYYGVGDYGTERPEGGSFQPATTWSLDHWGQILIACSDADGTIWEWNLLPASPATAVTNAPLNNKGIIVTEERFLFALGAGNNPRKVQWSDREDRNAWTPAITNQSGEIELQTQGQIMSALRTRGQTLILTDQDAHTATYRGKPFVYGFERVGSACGVVSRRAAVSVDAGAIWMGPRGFFIFNGGSVQPLLSDVGDFVFAGLNRAQVSKVYAVSNSQWGEVWWFYPSGGSTECDRYVCFNYVEGFWTIGSIARTCGVDVGAFGNPLWVSPSGVIYTHESGLNYSGAEVFAESGPISLGAGDQVLSAIELIPDEQTQGDTTATFKTRFHPNDTERTYGPYTLANPTPVRFTGRQVRMRVTGAQLANWRVGVPRLDVRPGGRR